MLDTFIYLSYQSMSCDVMPERVIITFDDEVLATLKDTSEAKKVSRNLLVAQICRKHFGLENVLQEEP